MRPSSIERVHLKRKLLSVAQPFEAQPFEFGFADHSLPSSSKAELLLSVS